MSKTCEFDSTLKNVIQINKQCVCFEWDGTGLDGTAKTSVLHQTCKLANLLLKQNFQIICIK